MDVRIVSASNRDLRQEVREGRFRQDLYFRLAVITVSIPPLRERKEDILVLADYFLQEFCADLGRQSPSLSDATTRALLAHDWPGNVRELKNAMQQQALLCDNSVVEPHSLPGSILLAEPSEPRAIPEDGPLKDPVSLKESKRRAFAETEKRRISEALQMFNEYLEVYLTGAHRAEALRHVAAIHFNSFEYEKSIRAYMAIHEEAGTAEEGIEAYYKTGICYQKMGYEVKAQGVFQSIIEQYPYSSYAYLSRIQIDLLKIIEK